MVCRQTGLSSVVTNSSLVVKDFGLVMKLSAIGLGLQSPDNVSLFLRQRVCLLFHDVCSECKVD